MNARIVWIIASVCYAWVPQFALEVASAEDLFESAPIRYSKTQAENRVTRLQDRLHDGSVRLAFDDKFGYLPSVLDALEVHRSSQVLVFSKTSFQLRHINPEAPRAVYFGDDVYLGAVQRGDVLEISVVDPKLGAVFYTLDQDAHTAPKFKRRTDDCLQCHVSSLTGQVPGHLVRSVYPDEKGHPILSAGTFHTTHASPLAERWGGWYVTGTHAKHRHMGNLIVAEGQDTDRLNTEAGANQTSLPARVDPIRYLTPHSDIVALMVLEHQTQIHNRITQAGYAVQRAVFDRGILNSMLDLPATAPSESTKRRVRGAIEPLVEGLFFCDEVPLHGPIQGTSKFAEEFMADGPRDKSGRSLRTLDLNRRMFKHPFSYLIYSPAIDALPEMAKARLALRIDEVLAGKDPRRRFRHLSEADRKAIREILVATKPDLADRWATRG